MSVTREQWVNEYERELKKFIDELAEAERSPEAQAPPAEDPDTVESVDYDPNADLTDLHNARLFVHQHGARVRYLHDRKAWFLWDKARWTADLNGEVERRAKQTIDVIRMAAARETDRKRQLALYAHAMKSETAGRIRSMLELSRSESKVATRSACFDQNPWLLNCKNGTIDLRSGTLRNHSRKDLITRLVPADFDPDAKSPRWDAFLKTVTKDDADLVTFLRRSVGYSLTGDISEQVMFVAFGTGANGKSTFLNVVETLLADYASRTPTETLLSKPSGEGVPSDVARLAGSRFVSAVEAEDGRRISEGRVKAMTGGDLLTARFLYGDWFEFRPQFKLWLATNHKPRIRGTDEAIWRRIRLIPFQVFIEEPHRDPKLQEKLEAELAGILAWAVSGCLEWQSSRLAAPPAVREATAAYREEEDPLSSFMHDRCTRDDVSVTKFKDLYAAYLAWAKDAGEQYPISSRTFATRLTDRGIEGDKSQDKDREAIRYGIRLNEVLF